MGLNPDFWRGRKVFLTGHTGFKGAWLCFWLHCFGAKVSGYSLSSPTSPSLFKLLRPALPGHFVTADIRDFPRLQSEIKRRRPEIVFHLAAQSLVRESYRDPLGTYSTNVVGTANVLEAARRTGSVRAVVAVTSDKCYEGALPPRRENSPLGGSDPYSTSKACAELVVRGYRTLCPGIGVATARAGNVIGGGDWAAERLVPDCMRSFRKKRPVRIRYPLAVRPWQHVLEPIRGYLLLGQRLYEDPEGYSEAWNFGPGKQGFRNVGWMVRRLSRLWGGHALWEPQAGKHPPEAPVLKLDSSKARFRLGWRPGWDLEEATEKTVEWYRAYFRTENMVRHTQAQIESFERRSPR